MRESGVVVSVDGDTVNVVVEPSEACGSCGMCSDAGGEGHVLEGVTTNENLSPGDRVIVVIPSSARRIAWVLAFAVPVASMLVGYLAGFLLGSTLGVAPDSAGALMAVGAGLLAFAALPSVSRRAASLREVRAIIARGHGAYPHERNGARCDPPLD